ncbi:MAG: putative membrane protein YecN with MAPEG domain [Psychrosphaera sp.]|jgi:uncharacterized membrane protein YecN with MAPEG domain|uniref:MAPEG family protein n=1 Tax=Psychrosphaera aquimarina TaxID=2044854 RepID=A0ABU3R3E5_9GAMM|nr:MULTISPECIES: MAPEG family protein [Psychrosphaera]MBU2919000.1 MAPEG family protein [Psychrosphaera sp. F3M07]MDU0114199.1 MAPEG family protein [Psychrosphaera aquimarina]
MNVEFTAFYAGILGLFYVALSFRVILLRRKFQVGIGHGKERELHRAIRVHGNFSEYVPLALFLLLLLELNGGQMWVLHVLGSMLFLGRILHVMGLSKSAGTSMPRFVGGTLTFGMMMIAAVLNILVVY